MEITQRGIEIERGSKVRGKIQNYGLEHVHVAYGWYILGIKLREEGAVINQKKNSF